jgi:hypothetical protein
VPPGGVNVKTAAEFLQAHFHDMKADFDAWCALYTEDAVMEYPYGAYAGVDSPLKASPISPRA